MSKRKAGRAEDRKADGKGLESHMLNRDSCGLRQGTVRDEGGQGSQGSHHEQRALTQ